MSYGKQSGGSTTTPLTSPTQQQQVGTQSAFLQGNMMPAAAGVLKGGQDVYNATAGGVNQAASSLAGTANQAQNVLGTGGQSAYTSGINALQNLTSPEYQQQQMQAAMFPAQQQYQQNLAAQQAGFGGAGQLGSARSAIAQQALAGTTQAQQQAAGAGVMRDIAQQQLAAGGQLGQLGQGSMMNALQAGQAGLTAAGSPMDYFQKYASVLGQVPGATYTPSYAGMTGQSTSTSGSNTGISL